MKKLTMTKKIIRRRNLEGNKKWKLNMKANDKKTEETEVNEENEENENET